MYRLKPVFALFAVCLISALLLACGDDDPASEPPPTEEPEPRISVDVSSLDFGAVDVGETEERTAEVRNIGDGTLSGEVSLSGSAAYAVVGGEGNFSLGEGATREVTVRFAPEDEGEAEATLAITHAADNESSPLTVPAIGEGRIQLASPPGRP
jgi:hypothetical protein